MATERGRGPLRREDRVGWLFALAVALVLATALVVGTSAVWPRREPGAPPSRTALALASPAASSTPRLPRKPTAAPPTAAPTTATPEQELVRADCRAGPAAVARADELLANRYTLNNMPTVQLPVDPRWNENPIRSRNWEFQYHSLRFILNLTAAYGETRDERYLERARVLLRDWVADNPRRAGRSVFSWNDHATAWRAVVLACAAELLPEEPWLTDALVLHGRTLADPAFYVGHGNHALNQSVGLLDVGCRLGRRDWMDLAATRLERLVRESVDVQGVTNEQSVYYEFYNWTHYDRARRRLDSCGVAVPASLTRIERMPDFLAHATLPNGEYVMIGATPQHNAAPIPGTTAEFAATQGAAGPRPTARFAIYDAGFAFGRTGWGDERPFADEIAWSARFGPGLKWHGHADGLSMTLYGYGSRLVEDPGVFTYNADRWHSYGLSRAAHNVVIVDGLGYSASRPTTLLAHSSSATSDFLLLRNRGVAGVEHRRGIVFSPQLGYVLVDDALTSAGAHTYHQLWHLVADGDPIVAKDGSVHTRRERGNIAIVQLLDTGAPRIVMGQTNPVQGWFSRRLEDRIPAPVVDVPMRGRSVRYLTLLVPSAGKDPAYEVRDLEISPGGFSLTVSLGGVAETVRVDGTNVSVEPAAP